MPVELHPWQPANALSLAVSVVLDSGTVTFYISGADRLVAHYEEVRNIRKIAIEFKMSRTTVAKHLGDRGITTTKSMTPDQITRAVDLYAEGLSSIAIGKQLGFDNHTILNALRSKGMTIRPALGI